MSEPQHCMITWGMHPDGYAPRCTEFLQDLVPVYSRVTCVDCLQQIIADLTEQVAAQKQAIADLEWQVLPPTHDLPSTYYNGA